MITEWELECALFKRFESVLPDLARDGYVPERQVILRGTTRRMDIVLLRTDHAWIIELKRGSPDVKATSEQLLDYEKCWKAARPTTPVSLMVISNGASEGKIEAFRAAGIEHRAVPAAKILEVLSEGISTELLGKCISLEADDEGRIRFLLSNFAHTTVPAGMRFGLPWSHESIYYALIRDGRRCKDAWKKNIYVELFAQKNNCAILYHPEAANADRVPVHINTAARSWPSDGWLLEGLTKSGTLVFVERDAKKGRKPSTSNFDHYQVTDWDRFAEFLELRPKSL